MLAKKLALLVPLLALALPQTSGELGLVSRASRLSVYPPVPGLDPSPYYGLRVREVSKSLKSAGASKAQSFLRSDNHDHSHQPKAKKSCTNYGHNHDHDHHRGETNLDQIIITRSVKKAGKTCSHC